MAIRNKKTTGWGLVTLALGVANLVLRFFYPDIPDLDPYIDALGGGALLTSGAAAISAMDGGR